MKNLLWFGAFMLGLVALFCLCVSDAVKPPAKSTRKDFTSLPASERAVVLIIGSNVVSGTLDAIDGKMIYIKVQ
jgi:hypothetical protein